MDFWYVKESSPYRILSMGYASAPHAIGNEVFDRLDIGCSSLWVEQKTGIENRYSVLTPEEWILKKNGEVVSPKTSTQDLALNSWSKSSVVDEIPVDWVLNTSMAPDWDLPSQASLLAKKLGWNSACCFDMSAGCHGFIVQLQVAMGLLQKDSRGAALFQADRYTLRVDYKDRRSCFLFGDGGSSCFLARTRRHAGLAIMAILTQGDPSQGEAISMPHGGVFHQDGSKIQKFAIQKTVETAKKLMEIQGLSPQDISTFIGHQANLRMLNSCAEKLGLTKQHKFNVHLHGNQGAVGAPSVLSQNWGNWKKGDWVLLVTVGAGLLWGGAIFQWQEA